MPFLKILIYDHISNLSQKIVSKIFAEKNISHMQKINQTSN